MIVKGNNYTLYWGDCVAILRGMADNSIDAIVTDPPYGLRFMGKKWDYDVPSVEVWAEALRVLKPGGHALIACGTRTQHRMVVNIEDAGFEVRDVVSDLYDTNTTAQALIESLTPEQMKLLDATLGRDGMALWVYGSGFPKSHNISKKLDQMAGAAREVVGQRDTMVGNGGTGNNFLSENSRQHMVDITAPATEAAKQWDGWGSALKPAVEFFTLVRKPLAEPTLAANVLVWGTGGINVDGCRVGTEMMTSGGSIPDIRKNNYENSTGKERLSTPITEKQGRWPANLIHDGSDEVTACFPETTSGARKGKPGNSAWFTGQGDVGNEWEADSGSASRFFASFPLDDASRIFYCPKASKRDRDEGLDGFEERTRNSYSGAESRVGKVRSDGATQNAAAAISRNHHATVKPTALMQYLCRLITPPGGVVLDLYMGSGSTGKAAMLEGFQFVGIDIEPEYVAIAQARIAHAEAEASKERQLSIFDTQAAL